MLPRNTRPFLHNLLRRLIFNVRRRYVDDPIKASCAPARLVGLKGTVSIQVVSSRNICIKGVRSYLGGDNKGRCVRVSVGGVVRCLLRFPLARLSVYGVRSNLQRGSKCPGNCFNGIVSSVVCMVRLSAPTGLPTSNFPGDLLVMLRGMYLSQRAVRQQLFRGTRVASASRARVGDPQGQHYHRHRCVRVFFRLLSLLLIDGARTLLLVGSRGSGVFGFRVF